MAQAGTNRSTRKAQPASARRTKRGARSTGRRAKDVRPAGQPRAEEEIVDNPHPYGSAAFEREGLRRAILRLTLQRKTLEKGSKAYHAVNDQIERMLTKSDDLLPQAVAERETDVRIHRLRYVKHSQ